MIFLIGLREFVWPPAALCCEASLAEVPLDGSETKSEDYQRDVSRRAAQSPMTAVIWVKVPSQDGIPPAASGHVFDLESVAG
jgi:hypothetical protein